MGCMFYRRRRRPRCTAQPPYHNKAATTTPPVSNGFYGLDTVYDPGGGMVPMKQNGSPGRGKTDMGTPPYQNMLTPEEAFAGGTLFPDHFTPRSADIYR